jgi:tetratricopeptide (TPR) repeat protein
VVEGRWLNVLVATMLRLGILASLLVLGSAGMLADEYSELFREAASYTQEGKYEEAVLKYKAALKLRPEAPEALNNLAVMYYQLRKYPDALDLASRIWKTHPELKSAALIAGLSAVQCKQPRNAIAPLETLLASDPSNRDALLGLASAHLALNEFAEAAQVYQRETGYQPSDSTGWYGLAICYEQMAENASRQLANMPGGAAYSKRLLAEYLQSTGDSRLASEAFGEFQTLSADSSPAALQQYEKARGLAGKSRNAFEHLIKVAPDSWQAAIFLGDVARQHGDLVSAIAYYKRAAGEQPTNPAPLLGLGTAYWEMGDFEQASSYLHRTLELNPDAKQALFELANIAVRRHQERDAIPLLKQYLAVQPDALAAHADLGRAYSHLGHYGDAVRELEKAAAADERGEIHYQLSIALRKLGRPAEAEIALKESNALRDAELQREQRLHSDR